MNAPGFGVGACISGLHEITHDDNIGTEPGDSAAKKNGAPSTTSGRDYFGDSFRSNAGLVEQCLVLERQGNLPRVNAIPPLNRVPSRATTGWNGLLFDLPALFSILSERKASLLKGDKLPQAGDSPGQIGGRPYQKSHKAQPLRACVTDENQYKS